MKHLLILLITCWLLPLWAQDSLSVATPRTLTFPSLDGVTITADLYHVADSLPVMLLCHQASYSRGEYIETAHQLNQWGFNCLAIDQRSGKSVNGVKNQTHWDAQEKGRPTNYPDAEIDLIAAINYLVIRYQQDVILLGSSYSASLALKLANEHDRVRAALAFSPGEYFRGTINVSQSLQGIAKPIFVTSSRSEASSVRELLREVEAVHFVPKAMGAHGSKVLWSTHKGREEYWEALKAFLAPFSPWLEG